MSEERDKQGRFVKGQSGNPSGRPKENNFKKELVAVLEKEKDGVTDAQRIISGLIERAIDGDTRAATLLFEYAYGKPDRADEGVVNIEKGVVYLPSPVSRDEWNRTIDERIQRWQKEIGNHNQNNETQ